MVSSSIGFVTTGPCPGKYEDVQEGYFHTHLCNYIFALFCILVEVLYHLNISMDKDCNIYASNELVLNSFL